MLSRSPLARPTPSGFIAPCLPTPSRTVPEGSRWAFEVKHDGFRFLARRDGDRVRVLSRTGWADAVLAMMALPVASVTLDCEGVVCDDPGVTDFVLSGCAPPLLGAAARARCSSMLSISSS